MKILPYMVFCFLLVCALCAGMRSYRSAENRIAYDVNQALKLALQKMPDNVVTTDTIQCYRNHLSIEELRDTAGIAMRTIRKGNHIETQLVAEANCSPMTIFRMSDQKASGALCIVSILWLLGSLWYTKKNKPALLTQGVSYGGIVFHDNQFKTISGEEIRLTPMQHTLLEMFFTADTHTLTKQTICDRLWPRKPDANDTLYTLIRRIKPIIENHSHLKIESNRGKSYTLEIK